MESEKVNINVVDFMAYQTEISPLNVYQYVLTYIISIYIIEIFCGGNEKRVRSNIDLCCRIFGYECISHKFLFWIEKLNNE